MTEEKKTKINAVKEELKPSETPQKHSRDIKSVEAKKADNKTKVPDKFKKLVEEIEKMSVLELSELVKVLEEKFGVSAAMGVMAASSQAVSGASGAAAGVPEEKSTVDVILKNAGPSKIQIIKLVKEITGKGLKEAKDLTDQLPQPVKTGLNPEEAEELKKKIEGAGGEAEIK